MEEQMIYYLKEYSEYAALISIFISIIVAVFGVIPSFFITGANIIFFGFWTGTILSFVGESLGAIVAFYLYRRGLKKYLIKSIWKYPKLEKLISSKGKEAFFLIFSLRLLPFVPSGLVTLTAAIGNISLILFSIASTTGKIPSMLIEAYSVYQVTKFDWQGKIIVTIVAILVIFQVWKRRVK